jgi:hypothetical protein
VRPGAGTRSLSSSEAVHASGELKAGRSLSSGQGEFPFSPARDTPSRSPYDSGSLVRPARPGGERGDREPFPNGVLYRYAAGRSYSGSGSRTLNGGPAAPWRSKVPADYDELSTAELSTVELSEEAASPGDGELVSVLVTQPETRGNSAAPAEDQLPADHCVVQLGASKYTMEDLEEFLQSVEACLPNGTVQAFEQSSGLDIQTLLAAIASCPEMDFIGCFPAQVPKNSSPPSVVVSVRSSAIWLNTCFIR